MLTTEQIENRRNGIGGSDARQIMEGNWFALWQEKLGLTSGPQLDDVLAVQMGSFTEPFNAHWFTKKTGIVVDRSVIATGVHYHGGRPWMLCHPDGIIRDNDGVIDIFEAKHTGVFEDIATITARYYPQCQHNMEVLNARKCYLSVFRGNAQWEFVEIERNLDYIAALMEQEATFWQHVLDDVAPADQPGKILVPVESRKPVNMTGNNEWAEHAQTWLETKPAVDKNADASAGIKAVFPREATIAFGHGVVVAQSKDGKLTLREPSKADQKIINALTAEAA